MLTDKHIDIIKSTIPLLENAGPAMTAHFYQRLFKHNPELQDIFNMSNQRDGRQQVALFEAIAAYAKNIDNLSVLTPAVERIAQKHTSFNIQADHYAVVGHHLIETLRELAPEAFTSEVEIAWGSAYQFLASIFIARESELYHQRSSAVGGWQGTRAFTVIDKIPESDLVTSFIFEPKDKKAVIDFSPGQYLGIEVQPQGDTYKEIRQYSLSNKANGKTYRISVKREQQAGMGKVSNYFHDNINIGDDINLHAPAGDFFYQENHSPTVLISAGVGITPMQAMLEALHSEQQHSNVHFLHACENSAQHSFAERTTTLVNVNNWQQKVWYQHEESPLAHIDTGFMDLSTLTLPIATGHYYLCGPVGFMQFVKKQLLALGIEDNRIHYEVFGPHESL